MSTSYKQTIVALLSAAFMQVTDARCEPEHEAYIAIDSSTNAVLVSKKPDQKIQPASMTKMMTLLLFYEAVQDGLFDLDEEIEVPYNVDINHSSLWKGPYSVQDIVHGVAMESYNDLAVLLAGEVVKRRGLGISESHFVLFMNSRAMDLGMSNTVFYNASGLPDLAEHMLGLSEKGTTAYDMVHLLQYISENQSDLAELLGTKFYRTAQNEFLKNNNFLLYLDEQFQYQLVFGKTGYTCDAGHALTTWVTFKNGQSVILSYAGADSIAERQTAVLNIIKAVEVQLGSDNQSSVELAFVYDDLKLAP